jgi:hypothetical protein
MEMGVRVRAQEILSGISKSKIENRKFYLIFPQYLQF